MDANHSPAKIKGLVVEAFEELGVEASGLAELRETLLILDGKYHGRSYRAGGLLAMWLISVKLIQFYGQDGSMLGTISLGHEANDGCQESYSRQAA